MNRAAQGDDLTALAQVAALHPDPSTFGSWLERALASGRDGEGVTLATVHRVKGLEWGTVVVHHVDHEQFPHRLADDVEEERRLFHVAITRSSDLTVVVPSATPSPFVEECRTPPPPRPPSTTPRSVMTKSGAGAARPHRATTTAPPAPSSADAALFDQLKQWRRTTAAGKPAYTVFSDATLLEIARRRPHTLQELGRIKGVGPAKLSAHGSAVLEVVARHAGA